MDDDDPEIAWQSLYCLRQYNSYWLPGHTRNPAFVKATDGRLLDFKEGQGYAIEKESRDVAAILEKLALPRRVLLALIPGHEAKASNAGTPLATLVKLLAARDERLVPAPDLLIRHTTIEKLAAGGDRSVAVHVGSIRVQPPPVLKEVVVVLDDVASTGNSMEAVRSLLRRAGAAKIAGIAIGRTVKLF